MMSTPYSPENQQPYQPQQGGYPQQAGYQPGAYGQQPTQQMPVVGGYGQPLGYGQQGQQDFYGQGQFPGAPGDGAPEKKKTGLIIGIIAAVVVVLIAAGVAIWWFMSGDDSSDDAAAQSAPSSAAPTAAPSSAPSPSAPVAPAPAPTQSAPPVGTKPSPAPTPTQGSGPSSGVSSDEEYGVKTECKAALSQTVQTGSVGNWMVERDGVDNSGRPQYLAKGQLRGTLLTGKSGTFDFTCTVVYHTENGLYEAWAAIDAY